MVIFLIWIELEKKEKYNGNVGNIMEEGHGVG